MEDGYNIIIYSVVKPLHHYYWPSRFRQLMHQLKLVQLVQLVQKNHSKRHDLL